jgi:hypothetical protein
MGESFGVEGEDAREDEPPTGRETRASSRRQKRREESSAQLAQREDGSEGQKETPRTSPEWEDSEASFERRGSDQRATSPSAAPVSAVRREDGGRASAVAPSEWPASAPTRGAAKRRSSFAALSARVLSVAAACGCCAGSGLRGMLARSPGLWPTYSHSSLLIAFTRIAGRPVT